MHTKLKRFNAHKSLFKIEMGILSSILQNDDANKADLSKLYYLDFADRLNWEYTVNLLVVITFIISNARFFVNKVISCVVPMYFSANQEEYANEICYITINKYYVSEHERIYVFENFTDKIQINYINSIDNSINDKPVPTLASYYVWIPYILIMLSIFMAAPRYIWSQLLKKQTAIDMDEMLKAASKCRNLCANKTKLGPAKIGMRRNALSFPYFNQNEISFVDHFLENDENFEYLTFHLGRTMLMGTRIKYGKSNTLKKRIFKFFLTKKLLINYMLIKMLTFILITLQILLINYLLGVDLYIMGLKPFIGYIFRLLHDKAIKLDDSNELNDGNISSFFYVNSHYFPLKCMCTFKIKELSKTNIYATMCSLPINLFIQYSFMFLSVWYFVLLIFNFYNFFSWSVHFRKSSHYDYIRKRLLIGFKTGSKKHLHASSLTKRNSFINGAYGKCSNLAHLHKSNSSICNYCKKNLDEFIFDFLNFDFRFLLDIILSNSDEALIQQILIHFWQIYRDNFIGNV